jgi:hypothetical protein
VLSEYIQANQRPSTSNNSQQRQFRKSKLSFNIHFMNDDAWAQLQTVWGEILADVRSTPEGAAALADFSKALADVLARSSEVMPRFLPRLAMIAIKQCSRI